MLCCFFSVVQDAASKKSNNLLLDTSDLAISQYSLLGQTPPRSAPDSPAIHTRDSSSAKPDENKESTPEVEKESQTVTADVLPPSDPEHCSDDKSDPSATSDQNTVLPSPVIVVTQQLDESTLKEAPCFNETSEEVQLGAEKSSAMDSATAESCSSDTPDSDAAVTQKPGTPEPPTVPEPTNPIPVSSISTSSSPQSTDVPVDCAQYETPKTTTSNQISEEDTSSQPSCPSPSLPPCTDVPVKISLGSLSEVFGCSSTAPSNVQQTTDRAVYMTGEIKDNWEVERVKEEKEKEAAEEKTEEDEEKGSGLEKKNSEEEAKENGDNEEKEEKVKEEVLHSSEPTEPQSEGSAEPPLGSVALIRDLVTEITEVEVVVSPCPSSSDTP